MSLNVRHFAHKPNSNYYIYIYYLSSCKMYMRRRHCLFFAQLVFFINARLWDSQLDAAFARLREIKSRERHWRPTTPIECLTRQPHPHSELLPSSQSQQPCGDDTPEHQIGFIASFCKSKSKILQECVYQFVFTFGTSWSNRGKPAGEWK